MAIYTFVQNDALANTVDAVRVWVIADNTDQALDLASNSGSFYLDPDYNTDCPCCGNRWDDNPVVVSSDDIKSIIDRDVKWLSNRSYLADVIVDGKAVRCDNLQDVMNALGL